MGTGCLRSVTRSRYCRACSTVFPRIARASSTLFFHAIGSSRPYARAIVSFLKSTVYPSFAIVRPHLSGMNFDERVAPTPGPLWETTLRVIANAPRRGAQLLDDRQAVPIDTADEGPAGAGGEELDNLIERHRLHLLHRVPAVRELLPAAGLDNARALPQLPAGRPCGPAHPP